MRPVARWQLMMALTLSVPEVDWLTPWLKTVTVLAVLRQTARRSGRPPGRRGPSAWRFRQGRAPTRRQARSRSRWCGPRYRRGRARRFRRGMAEQAGEQRDVAVRRDRQMQVGDVGGHRPARIDQHDLHPGPLLLGRGDPLVEHRVAPGEVRADQHDEIGKLEILVAAGHGVGAEGAAMAGDRRGHAQARIGVDVGRADEPLHQLVGDVVVLGQQLARDVEGDGIRAVLGDRLARRSRRRRSSASSQSTRRAADFGMEQPVLQPERLGERRALRAQPPEIGRMVGVAADARPRRPRRPSPARRNPPRNRGRWSSPRALPASAVHAAQPPSRPALRAR